MSFAHIQGQATAIQTLSAALRSRLIHHAYRFQGPPGVGKELAAFAFAAALVCDKQQTLGCGECSACRRALTLSEEAPCVPLHPDVVLLEKGLYSAAQLGTKTLGLTGIGQAQVQRMILDRVPYAPHEGRAIVFILRDADELTVRASNTLLKTLEEPRAGIYFILLTHRPDRLLGTIRSRSLPIRFGPLPDSTLAQILKKNGLSAPDESIALAGGSAQRLLDVISTKEDQLRTQFLASVERAIESRDLGLALQFAAAHKPDRNSLEDQLQALGHAYSHKARQQISENPSGAQQAALMYEQVQVARTHIERNTPPILVLETLIARLRRVHRGQPLAATP